MDDDTLNLPIAVIRSLMFGFQEYWGEHSLSRARHEPEPHFPKLVPKEIGELIASRDDKLNPKFYVAIYPSHAEVWHIDEWKLSISRRYHVLYKSTEATARERGKLLDQIKSLLIAEMPGLGDRNLSGKLDAVARALAKAPRETTDKIKGLTELIYGK